jgi:hypothetical protein
MSKQPPKGRSGEHPAVCAFREKMASLSDHTCADFDEQLERAREAASKISTIPAPPEPEPVS